MKRLLSIISIILLLGVTASVPYYSSICYVYATESSENLTDNQILNAGISTYLNARNGFITISDGTVSGASILMNNTIDSFILFYNANHSIQNKIEKSNLIGSILVRSNPFRVSLKGFAVQFFNDLYDYLEDNGKVENASSSNGGTTIDNLYNGRKIGNDLFYYIDGSYNTANYGTFIKLDSSHVDIGTSVKGLSADIWKNNYVRLSGATLEDNPENGSFPYYYYIEYYDDIQYKANIASSPSVGNSTYQTLFESTTTDGLFVRSRNNSFIVWSNNDGGFRGQPCYFIDKQIPNTYYRGIVTYICKSDRYVFYTVGSFSVSSTPISIENINFETDDFQTTSTTVPEQGKEVQYTPRDKSTNDTYNTYNDYINNYYIKNTKIVKKIINEGDSGEDDPTNPSDPTQPTTQNPYPLDPTDPSAPTGGTIPDWTTPSGNGGSGTITPDGNGGYTFELPDFSLPDLDINWSISGLSEKFPFSIPFDLLAFFTVLNAEPQTPAIQATIPLGIWEWEIDWDLHDFDNLAGLLRNLEFIGFCIGLALITRNIIKG